MFASFFTFVRAFLKQEFRSPWLAIATSMISLGTALFAGHIIESWGAEDWIVRMTIAAGALLAYDVLRAILHFGSKVDGNTFWALFRAYTGHSGLPEKLPTDKKDPE